MTLAPAVLDNAHLVTRRHPALDRVGGDGAREHDDVDLTVYASCATRLYAEAWRLHGSRVASLSVAGPCRACCGTWSLRSCCWSSWLSPSLGRGRGGCLAIAWIISTIVGTLVSDPTTLTLCYSVTVFHFFPAAAA